MKNTSDTKLSPIEPENIQGFRGELGCFVRFLCGERTRIEPNN